MRFLLFAALAAAVLPAARAQIVVPELEGRAAYRAIDSLFSQPGVRAVPGGVVAEIDVPLAEGQVLYVFLSRDGLPVIAADAPSLVAVTAQGDTVRSVRMLGSEELAVVDARAGTVRLSAPGLAQSDSHLELASFLPGVGARAIVGLDPGVGILSARPVDASAALVARATAGEPVLVNAYSARGRVSVSVYAGDAFERGAPALPGVGGVLAARLWIAEATGPLTVVFTQMSSATADTARVAMLGLTGTAFVPPDSLRARAVRRQATLTAASVAAGCPPLTVDLRAGTVNGIATPTEADARALACPADRAQPRFRPLGPRGLYFWTALGWTVSSSTDATVEPDVFGATTAEAIRTLGFEAAPGLSGAFVTPYGCLYVDRKGGGTVDSLRIHHAACGE